MLGMIETVTSDTRLAQSGAAHDGTYHHGDLPNALRRAAVQVIEERGLGGFSLREVARRAGVSHTAPAHHFGDMRGLLTSVATEGFEALRSATAAAAAQHDDPAEQLTAIGEAYVALARSNRGHCEVMFRTDVVDTDDPQFMEAGLLGYAVLEDTVRALLEADDLSVDLDHATWLCWSSMQGLVVLGPKLEMMHQLKGGAEAESGDLVRRFTEIIVSGLRNPQQG